MHVCVCQLYEPIELEQSHYTDFDQEVRVTDMPERFQLRTVPICPTEEGELDEEAEWIYRHAFSTPPVSRYFPPVVAVVVVMCIIYEPRIINHRTSSSYVQL